jgi:hypothetical protein
MVAFKSLKHFSLNNSLCLVEDTLIASDIEALIPDFLFQSSKILFWGQKFASAWRGGSGDFGKNYESNFQSP